MSSEEYKESDLSKIVKRLMDEEGFEFGEAVREAMEQTKNFESKADGGSIGIDILFQDKMANGGRAGYVSGGAALKLLEKGKEGIASLYNTGKSIFSKGDDVVDIAKQEEIFRSGNITTDFLENVDDKVIKKFVATRDAKGPGGYGLYDSFDDMPNGLKAAELISRIKNAEGGINYEAAELFIGKKLKGNETVDELISMVVTEKMADGGRVGLFMGGDPLDGQALSIYNSMNAYGFDDQAIANALQEQGLYDPNASTTDPTPDTGQTIGYQGDGGGGGGGGGGMTTLDPLTRQTTPMDPNNFLNKTVSTIGDFTGSMIDKFSGTNVGEGITSAASKFKNIAITPMMALMQKRNPLNPNASNYNPALQSQMDFLGGQTGTKISGMPEDLQFTDGLMMIGRDPNSGLTKYGPGSVLSGKNVVSGFGTNDYGDMLRDYINKMEANTRISQIGKDARLAQARAELAAEQERQRQAYIDAGTQAEVAALQQEIDSGKYSGGSDFAQQNQAAVGGGNTATNAQGQTASQATSAGTGTSQGYSQHYARGGLATMFTRRR